MKSVIVWMTVVAVTLAGCMGREANPVQIDQPGDREMSCMALKASIIQIDGQIKEKDELVTKKLGYNTIMFVGGFFLIVPWFFMDVKGAEEKENEALKQRRDHLFVIYADKECE